MKKIIFRKVLDDTLIPVETVEALEDLKGAHFSGAYAFVIKSNSWVKYDLNHSVWFDEPEYLIPNILKMQLLVLDPKA